MLACAIATELPPHPLAPPPSSQDEFCAGGPRLMAGSCPGDRGAPTLQSVGGTKTQVGGSIQERCMAGWGGR